MTENKAIEIIKYASAFNSDNSPLTKALEVAIQALEEIQQYRVYIEIFENHFCKEALELLSDKEEFGKWLERGKWIAKRCDEVNRELVEYQTIGTVEEFKALKEKSVAKKILYRKQSYGTPWLCPYCEADQIKVEFFSEDGSEPKEKYTFCWQCGTRIDWSE